MAMVDIIKVIDAAEKVEDVFKPKFNPKCFDIDNDSLTREIEGPVYGKRFARYLLLKLDYFYADHGTPMNVERLSVEHILPQKPAKNSNWTEDFTEAERAEWTDKIGNLVLITGGKNARLGRLDYSEKREKYFKDRITTCPRALHVFNKGLYEKWTPEELKKNHENALTELKENYQLAHAKV